MTAVEQAAGYSIFANGGKHFDYHVVIQVTRPDRPGRAHRGAGRPTQVITPEAAADADHRAAGGGQAPAPAAAPRLGDRPAAGKTGTNNENKEAWFVGFTPQIVHRGRHVPPGVPDQERQGRPAGNDTCPWARGKSKKYTPAEPVQPGRSRSRWAPDSRAPPTRRPSGRTFMTEATKGQKVDAVPAARRHRHRREPGPQAGAHPDADPDGPFTRSNPDRGPRRVGVASSTACDERPARRLRRRRTATASPTTPERGQRLPGRRRDGAGRATLPESVDARQARAAVTMTTRARAALHRARPCRTSPWGCSRPWGRRSPTWYGCPAVAVAGTTRSRTYTNFCYTDIYPLFFDRQLATQSPYFADVPFDKHVEYPVVLGEVMQASAGSSRLLEPEVPAQASPVLRPHGHPDGHLPRGRRAADGRGGRPDPALGRRSGTPSRPP